MRFVSVLLLLETIMYILARKAAAIHGSYDGNLGFWKSTDLRHPNAQVPLTWRGLVKRILHLSRTAVVGSSLGVDDLVGVDTDSGPCKDTILNAVTEVDVLEDWV